MDTHDLLPWNSADLCAVLCVTCKGLPKAPVSLSVTDTSSVIGFAVSRGPNGRAVGTAAEPAAGLCLVPGPTQGCHVASHSVTESDTHIRIRCILFSKSKNAYLGVVSFSSWLGYVQSLAIHLISQHIPDWIPRNFTKLADHLVFVGFISHWLAFKYTRPKPNYIINEMDECIVLWKDTVTKSPVAPIITQG